MTDRRYAYASSHSRETRQSGDAQRRSALLPGGEDDTLVRLQRPPDETHPEEAAPGRMGHLRNVRRSGVVPSYSSAGDEPPRSFRAPAARGTSPSHNQHSGVASSREPRNELPHGRRRESDIDQRSPAGVSEARLSGQYLAAMLQFAANQEEPDRAMEYVSDAVRAASEEEMEHEIIALGESQLVMNDANWMFAQENTDPERALLVVSFLGDTSAGKSHTIRELMDPSEARPYCQPSGRQSTATTFNVNLYSSTRVADGVTVNFVDYEGENGSDTPVMAAARTLSLSGRASRARYRAVTEFFPKLAYTTSDVIVVVSREPFFNRRYLERCIEFAKRANAGVTNVERPTLILVGNKLPGEECVEDVQESTSQFFEAWKEPARQLDQYFSTVICLYIPHKRGFWRDEHGRVVDGHAVFAEQIQKLKRILRVLAERRVSGGAQLPGLATPQRQITQHQGLWFALLPRVLRELNSGRGVDVSRLIDDVWAEAMARTAPEEEAELDMFKAFLTFLRPSQMLSHAAPRFNEDLLLRFDKFRQLVCDAAVRLVACRLRTLDRTVRLEPKVRSYARHVLEGVLSLVDDIAPCSAVYDPGATVPVDRPEEPVLCLQERRHHANHRTSRRVVGGTGLWGRLLGAWPCNESWEGMFASPALTAVSVADKVESVVELCNMDEREFLERLLALQQQHSGNMLSVGFVPISHPRRRDGRGSTLAAEDGSEAHQWPGAAPLSASMSSWDDASLTESISQDVFHQLQLLPTLTCLPSMPYCIACGVKMSPEGNRLHWNEQSGSNSGTVDGENGWLSSLIHSMMDWAGTSGEEGENESPGVVDNRENEGSSGGGGGGPHAADTDAGLTESDLWLAAQLQRGESRGASAALTHEPVWSAGDTGTTQEAALCQHIWLGLCPPCWHAIFVRPNEAAIQAQRGVPQGPERAPEFD